MSVECPSCLLPFNQGFRLPKVTPCDHTACLHCLRELRERQCPICLTVIAPDISAFSSYVFILLLAVAGLLLDGGSLLFPHHETTQVGLREQGLPNNVAGLLGTEASITGLPSQVAGLLDMIGACVSRRNDKAGLLEIDASVCEPDEALRLIRDQGVLRLKALACAKNPTWAADVLRAAAPLLEELQMFDPSHEHLVLAHGMPRLKTLFIEGFTPTAGTAAAPAFVQALPPLSVKSRLETLSLKPREGASMPLLLLQALLRAHGSAIKTLELSRDKWDWEGQVHPWIGECGLTALQDLYVANTEINENWRRYDERNVAVRSLERRLSGVNVEWFRDKALIY